MPGTLRAWEPLLLPCLRSGKLTQINGCTEPKIAIDDIGKVDVSVSTIGTEDYTISVMWKHVNTFHDLLDGFIMKVTEASIGKETTVYCFMLTLLDEHRIGNGNYDFNCFNLTKTSLPNVDVEIIPFPKSVWSHLKPLCSDIVKLTTAKNEGSLCDILSGFRIHHEIRGIQIAVDLTDYKSGEDYKFTLRHEDINVASSSVIIPCTTQSCHHRFVAVTSGYYSIEVKPNCHHCFYCTTIRSESFYIALELPPATVPPDPSKRDQMLIIIIIVVVLCLITMIMIIIAIYQWRTRRYHPQSGSATGLRIGNSFAEVLCFKASTNNEDTGLINNANISGNQCSTLLEDVCFIYSDDNQVHVDVVSTLKSYIESCFVCNVHMALLTSQRLVPTLQQVNILINSVLLRRCCEDINSQNGNATILNELGVDNTIAINFDYMCQEEIIIPHNLYAKYKLMGDFSEFRECLHEKLQPRNTCNIWTETNLRYNIRTKVEIARSVQNRESEEIFEKMCMNETPDGEVVSLDGISV
ncbi:hypothetical protein ScPMuIL_009670 [Solemya velum]